MAPITCRNVMTRAAKDFFFPEKSNYQCPWLNVFYHLCYEQQKEPWSPSCRPSPPVLVSHLQSIKGMGVWVLDGHSLSGFLPVWVEKRWCMTGLFIESVTLVPFPWQSSQSPPWAHLGIMISYLLRAQYRGLHQQSYLSKKEHLHQRPSFGFSSFFIPDFFRVPLIGKQFFQFTNITASAASSGFAARNQECFRRLSYH